MTEASGAAIMTTAGGISIVCLSDSRRGTCLSVNACGDS